MSLLRYFLLFGGALTLVVLLTPLFEPSYERKRTRRRRN